jgi:cell division septal protein FtsQ
LIFKNRFFWEGLLVLVFLGALFYFFFLSSVFQINQIRVSGNKRVPTEEIQNVIGGQIGEKIVFFQSKSIFLVDFPKIKKMLLAKFPNIHEIYLKRNFPDIVLAKIDEREAVANWCRGEDCFYLDKEGIIFEKGKEEGKLIIRSETSEGELVLGREAVEKKIVDAVLEIQKELKEGLGFAVNEFILTQEKNKLTVKMPEGWEVYFDIQKEVFGQFFNLDLTLKEKIPPEKRGNLEYIDLRFGNKVFFRYRLEPPQSGDVINKD